MTLCHFGNWLISAGVMGSGYRLWILRISVNLVFLFFFLSPSVFILPPLVHFCCTFVSPQFVQQLQLVFSHGTSNRSSYSYRCSLSEELSYCVIFKVLFSSFYFLLFNYIFLSYSWNVFPPFHFSILWPIACLFMWHHIEDEEKQVPL